MEDIFGMKELYDISLKSTFPMKIGNRQIEPDETILHLDSVEISTLDTVTSRVAAVGGFDNRPQVVWENIKQINYSLKQGVMSKTSWALISNSKIASVEAEQEKIDISYTEQLDADENGIVELKYKPFKMFVYNRETGEKIPHFRYTVENKKITFIKSPFIKVLVDYEFYYDNNKYETLTIGKRLLEGYLKLEGKIEFKDDKDGLEKTGILKIPKLLLTTDLSIRLGRDAQPFVGNIEAVGFPVGSRGNSSVCSITFLEDNLRSDI